jgi:hypothetical protein
MVVFSSFKNKLALLTEKLKKSKTKAIIFTIVFALLFGTAL